MKNGLLRRILAVSIAAMLVVLAIPVTASAATISVVAAPGGTVTPSSFDDAGSVNLTATAQSGYSFLHWDVVVGDANYDEVLAGFGNRYSSSTSFAYSTSTTAYSYYIVAVFGVNYFPPVVVTPPAPEPTPEPEVAPEPEPEPEFEPEVEAPLPKTGCVTPMAIPCLLSVAGLYLTIKGSRKG